MQADFILPFGGLIKRVKQSGRQQKDVFMLGNYSNTVNANWFSPDNTLLVKNLPIASEPSIFWSGNNADDIVKWVNIKKETGYLKPADKSFNGSSGRTLFERYLRPMGMHKDEIWLCNLVPYAQVFLSQRRDIEEFYMTIQQAHSLPVPNIPDFKMAEFRSEVRIKEIIEELEIANPSLIITLGDEAINYFIKKVSDCECASVKDFSGNDSSYGGTQTVKINNKKYDFLPLYHPRQLDGLGKSSQSWNSQHNKWLKMLPN